MRCFAAALFLLAALRQIASAENKFEPTPVGPQPEYTFSQPQGGPLHTTPAGVVPTTVGGIATPAPIGPRIEAPSRIRQVAAQSEISPKLAALRKKQAELNALQQEIRQLHAETGTQEAILVRVQLLELSLTKMRRFAPDLPLKPGYINALDLGQFLAGGKPGKGVPYSPPSGKSKKNESTSVADWLVSNNIGKILAEPNIVVVEGRPASFHVGGEVAIPAKDNPKSIEYRPTGTQLDVLATCLGEERVRLNIRASITNENYANSFQFGQMKLPTFDVKSFSSAVDSAFGEPCVLSGATENRTEAIKTTFGVREEINEICSILIVTPERVYGHETAQRPIDRPPPVDRPASR